MNVTFRQMRVFVEVAQQASMSRAAESLHLTPPAVSMQMREVESQAGQPLFDRSGRQLALTTAGEAFLVHARRLLADMKDAADEMAWFARLERRLLTIGIVSTAKYFVPRMLARFREERPDLELRLRGTLSREELVTLMQAGEVDLSVMGRPPLELATRSETFAVHPLVFISAPHHPLQQGSPLAPGALRGLPLVVREQSSGTRAAMAEFFAAARVEPRIAMETPSNETIKQLVMAGLGLGFLSLHTIALELRGGQLKILGVEGTPVLRSWSVVHLQSRQLSPAAEAFRAFLVQHGQAHLAAHEAGLLDDLDQAGANQSASS